MKITPQDIIDKEFKVKFRGFDMAEVDTFLEEVAENFFKLNEENTLLHEKVLALQADLEASGPKAPQGQMELPAELGSVLDDLKQDTASIGAELAAFKQDRQAFDSMQEKLEKVITSIQESGGALTSQPQIEFPPDLGKTLEEFKQNTDAVAAELAALKEDRRAFDSLKKSFEEVIGSAREAVTGITPQDQVEIPAAMSKAMEDFNQGNETVAAELADLKKEVNSITKIREEIKGELQNLLASRFAELEAKISAVSSTPPHAAQKPEAAPPAPKKIETLIAAEIVDEPEDQEEDTRLPYDEDLYEGSGDSALEFMSEDDILDVDKLRDVFQSVLDEDISDGHESRDGEDATADLLFLEEDFIEDDHEPEVTFSLDEKKIDNQTNVKKKST